jgi:hypothetical protein
LSHEKYSDKHLVCGFAKVLPLPLLNNIGYDLFDDDSPIDCIHLCTTVPARKELPPSANSRAGRQVQRNLEDIIDMVQRFHALVLQEFLPASVYRAKKSQESYSTQKDCTIPREFSTLNLRAWLAGWHPAV